MRTCLGSIRSAIFGSKAPESEAAVKQRRPIRRRSAVAVVSLLVAAFALTGWAPSAYAADATSTLVSPTSPSIVLGSSTEASATVTGDATYGSPTGTVSFYECGPTSSPTPCLSTADPVGNAVGVTAGSGNTSTANSVSFTPTSTGYWCFAADYSGDSNYASSSDTSSTDECFDVTVAPTSTVSAPASSSIVLGSSDTDSATVTGGAIGGSPTGTVSFYECGPTSSPTPCLSTADPVGNAVGVTAGSGNTSTANSVSFTPTSTGYWCFAADYSGDSNYASSSDTSSTDECFDVTVAPTSTVSAPASSSIVLGSSDTDSATVTGGAIGGSPTGTVSFYECGPTSSPTPCLSTADPVGNAVGVTAGSGNTSTANSVSFTPTSTGYWCFAADYSGDSNYASSSDTSNTECFDVAPYAYVANYSSGTVSVIDTLTNAVVHTVSVGSGPRAVAITPNGSAAYVANYSSGTVSVIDTFTNAVVNTVTVGSGPYAMVISHNGNDAYVANYGSNTVSVINTSTEVVVKTVRVGIGPRGCHHSQRERRLCGQRRLRHRERH